MIQNNSNRTGTTVIRGVISDLRKRKESRDAVFSPDDKTALQGTAVAAAALGLGSVAVGLSVSDEFTADSGDLMNFRLNDMPVEVWVWHSEFEEGDEVEVVAEWVGDKWIGFAVRRLRDGMVAVYPHCERGSRAFYLYVLKYIAALYGAGFFLVYSGMIVLTIYHHKHNWVSLHIFIIWVALVFGLIILFIAWRVTKRFAKTRKMADQIFSAFGWKKPAYINLPRETKRDLRRGDSPLMGIAIFRYNPK
ncbi:putative type VI secretion system effector (plasmid) [Robbsia andropogonis]|uniref:putative type VI secretion system effector n=1 Tax=Robbsia andropogonis TaxID=28092 RepID=UPI003D211B9F